MKKITETIIKLIAEHGFIILDQVRRFNAMLADLHPEEKRNRYLIELSLRANIPKKLLSVYNNQNLINNDHEIITIKHFFKEEYFIEEGAIKVVFDSWEAALSNSLKSFAASSDNNSFVMMSNKDNTFCIGENGPQKDIHPLNLKMSNANSYKNDNSEDEVIDLDLESILIRKKLSEFNLYIISYENRLSSNKSEEVNVSHHFHYLNSCSIGTLAYRLSYKERIEFLANWGFESIPYKAPDDSFLPEKFVVVDIDKEWFIHEDKRIWGLKIVVKDEYGKISTCSKQKCCGFYLEVTKDKILPLDVEIGADSSGNITLFNRKRLSCFSLNNAVIFDIIGRKFSAEKTSVFDFPRNIKYQSKEQALGLIEITYSFKVTEIL